MLFGDNLDNILSGLGGNDTIFGRSGNDTLDGGDGNDFLIGGAGVDDYFGGAGIDRVQYQDIAVGLRVDLLVPGTNTGAAAGEIFDSIENLLGSTGNDTILGDNGANGLFGFNGNDTIFGRDGADMLDGGSGNDFLIGGAGVDSFNGGTGTDRVQYQDFSTGFRIDLLSSGTNTGAAAGETYSSIENLLGSGGNDLLLGDNNSNDLFGFNGNDTLRGGVGNDSLNGGADNDVLAGDSGVDRFVFNGVTFGDDTITDYALGDFIDLNAFAGVTFASLTIVDVTGGAEASFSAGSITLNGFTAAQVDATFFSFA
jgi:Ca2+-binding RTX toxin-like protein